MNIIAIAEICWPYLASSFVLSWGVLRNHIDMSVNHKRSRWLLPGDCASS